MIISKSTSKTTQLRYGNFALFSWQNYAECYHLAMRYLSGKPTIEYAQAIWNFLHFPFGDTKRPLKTKFWVCICINRGSFTTLRALWALQLYWQNVALQNFVPLGRNYSPKSKIAILSRRVKLPLFKNLRNEIGVFFDKS